MLNRIIKFSLENRILILVLAVLLVIAGLYSTAKTACARSLPTASLSSG